MAEHARARTYRAIVAMGGLVAAAVVAPCVAVHAASPSVGSDHGEVVAQGVLQIDGGEVQWSASTLDIAAMDTLSSERPTFVAAAGGGPVLIHGSDGIEVVLDAGEAVFRPATVTSLTSALGTEPSHVAVLGVGSPGGNDAVGDSFVPGAGNHEVELLHGTLVPGQTLTVGGGLPVLLFVAAGEVSTRADGTTLRAGAVDVLLDDATIANATESPASVFIAVVGPAIDLTAPTTSTITTTTTTGDATISSAPAATPTSAVTTAATTGPTTTAPPATISTTILAPTTTATPPDSDGDGLSDSDEEAYGTNPGVFDTDGDGLGDGEEVFVYGTNPTDPNDP